jgi:cytochrome c peroxidase
MKTLMPGGARSLAVELACVASSLLLGASGCGGEAESGSQSEAESRLAVDSDHALRSLKGVPVPRPQDLGAFIADEQAAITLGKALFWDMQAGSDGQACASCHFHAGADHRFKNQLNPGQRNGLGPTIGNVFDPTGSGSAGGPNYTLVKADFPFHRLADGTDRNSGVLFDTDDVFSSQGVFFATFQKTGALGVGDDCATLPDIFEVSGVNVRRVESRHTPTVINAAFNFRNFWDGRANNVFNGVDPFGNRSPDAVIHVVNALGKIEPARVALLNSSLASQAVGPAVSPFEMVCDGRPLPAMGRKLLTRTPLRTQAVDPQDSVLGALRDLSGKGLSTTYRALVERAFRPRYWQSRETVYGFTLMESNFSLFWGLAIQLYEATLVSDDSRFDRFMEGDASALTAIEQSGLALFQGKAKCVACHSGPELTSAGTPQQAEDEEGGLVERMLMGDEKPALYDTGFYNIGVRPTVEDRGLGGLDPFGNPLSFSRQAKIVAGGGKAVDPFHVAPATFAVNPGTPVSPGEREAVDGAFKVPTLRNIALTGPYFHNGGAATLGQVLEFYNRGGNRRGPNGNDTTGFGPNPTNLDPDIEPLGLTKEERAAIIAFLKTLTDARVPEESAPFDHPQLFVPHGHPGNTAQVTAGTKNRATDAVLEIPAVGALGRSAKGLPQLTGF